MRRVILAAALAATFCLSQTGLAQTGDRGGAGSGAPASGAVPPYTQGPGASGGGVPGGPPTTGSFSVPSQPQGTPGGAGGTAERGGAGDNRATSSPRAGEKTVAGPASEDVQVELAKLRAEVDRLQAELDRAKGVRGGHEGEEAGTGGSGARPEQAAQPVASATFEGRVNKVSRQSIEVIDHETGEPYLLRVNQDTRASLDNQLIPVTGIPEGSEVRASFDLISGDTLATQIDVLGEQCR